MNDLILGGRVEFDCHISAEGCCRRLMSQAHSECRTDRQEQLSDHENNYHGHNTVQSGRPHFLRHGGALACLSFLRRSGNWENSLPSFTTLVRLAAD